jgi:uncharacterized phage-like protein YoqJ
MAVNWTDPELWTQDARDAVVDAKARGRVVAGTGHRPPRLGLGYDQGSRRYLTDFILPHLDQLKPELVISGGAQGVDQALALAALELRLPYWVAVPFDGQDAKWPGSARYWYARLLRQAERVVRVCPPGYAPGKFIGRDCFMVDACTHVITLFDGERTGGTWHTLNYAQGKPLPITNLWEFYSVPLAA